MLVFVSLCEAAELDFVSLLDTVAIHHRTGDLLDEIGVGFAIPVIHS
jgi:hypothetical protein